MISSRTRRSLATAVGALWLSAVGSAQAPQPGSAAPVAAAAALPKGSADSGKTLYVTWGCYACHGYAAQGGAGARLSPPATPALTAFIRYVRRPTNLMPPYTEKVVSDQQLADIHAYILTMPAPRDPATIPLLKGM